MKTYILVCPRETTHKRELKIMMEELDAKRYIIAREVGRSGYKHWQCRFNLSGDLRQWIERNGVGWHVEDANEVWDYEQKSGDYWCSWDTVEARKNRNGVPRKDQVHLLRSIDRQGTRRVTVWIDPKGAFGKTWLFLRGVHRGEVLPVPGAAITTSKLGGWIKSAWKNQPIIWIDIPRAHKIEPGLWAIIEESKNIAYEWRYASSWVVTTGVKILVTCNNDLRKEDLAALSSDRWDVHYIAPYYVSDGGANEEKQEE